MGSSGSLEMEFKMNNKAPRRIMATVCLLIATSAANGHAPEARDNARGKDLNAPKSLIYKLFPDYDVYSLSWEAYEQQRIEDIVETNAVLYDLTKEERERVASLAQKYDGAPPSKEKSKAGNEKFAQMIEERAEIVRSLEGKFDVDKVADPSVQKLITSSGLMKTQARIVAAEAQRNESVNEIRTAIEAMIGQERTQAAYSQWDHRLEEAKARVAIKSIANSIRAPREVTQQKREARERKRISVPTVTPMKTIEPKNDKTDVSDDRKATKRKSARQSRDEPAKKDEEDTRKAPPRRKDRGNKKSADKPVPLDKWEQYVRDFLEAYKCTPEQTNSALSILSELKGRAESLEKASKKQLDAANEIKDRRKRQSRIDAINAPIERLFDQLKRRLDGLLTSHQRAIKQAAEAKQKATGRRRKR